ncbi:hypothetical protein EMIHUDRAFT_458590 [Emiliania huxleyi CCMP1516]|uniref:HMG box domain-containing protein n=2 Tax=Emiliania huxleyi TaxID=2903 RepID=A0A0D3J9T0_EMIH1|nr:hypothetical protein EMIHUDRAFT_458590 [Emiliania huxleyi CCMP1516]EOD20265.1 hypothetical protein EMIHUDRAFT_458590 [Emiliania huxleyi CCMP1516]|eukprot:XP_005772694.1 hypothetical protein EMIHUDRAFT_458590 [Emiliania huxleyi CCMP1516]
MGFRRTAASSGASSGPGSVPAEDLRFASTAVLEQVAAECSEMPEQEVVPAEGTASGGNGSSTPWASSSDPESKADAEASQASVAPDTVAAGEAAGGVGEEEPEAPSSQVPEVVETDVEEHEDDEDGDGEVDPAARPAPAGSPAPIPEVVETDVEEHEGDEKEAPPSDPFSMPESEPRPTPAPATPSAAHAALTEASLEGDAPAEEEGDGPTPSAAPPVRRKLDSKPRKLGQPSGAAKSKPTPQRKPGEKPRAQKSRGEGAASEPKKKKAKKDPDAPKGALSAYMLWSMQERKSDAYAGMKVPEAGKALGATWKTMDEAARAPWVEASKEDHARHAREMASYVPSPEYARAQAAAPKARSGSSGGAKKAATPASRGGGKGAAASAASKKSAAGRKRKALARGDADSSDDEATPSKLAFSPPPPLADAPPPMLEDVGARVAWVPQCYNEFAKRYEAELDALQLVIDVPADLLESPADGTAHCAEIVAIHPAETEGWELLTLRGVPFGGGSGASEGAEYCLPYVPRRLCDVDQHVCALKEYLASRERALSASASPHVRVPFAAPDSEGEEELWEGRVWSRKPFDALNYPDSLYRCLNCVWYVASPREHEGASIQPLWVFDEEQTDNQAPERSTPPLSSRRTPSRASRLPRHQVSPWEALPSDTHGRWSKLNPPLAKLVDQLRVDRDTYSKLVPASESLEITDALAGQAGASGAALERLRQDTFLRVLKRLQSSEPGRYFQPPVPADEVEYYRQVDRPMCLAAVQSGLEGSKYASWAAFEADVVLIYGNAMEFNEEDSLPFYLAQMLEHEFNEAKELVRQALPAVLE